MNQYQCIRSPLLSGSDLAELIARLEKRYANAGFRNYRKDGTDCDFLGKCLPSLDPFAEVLVAHFASLPASPTDAAILEKLILEWGPVSRQHAVMTWRLEGIDFGGEVDRKAMFSAGLGRDGFHCYVSAALDKSLGYGNRRVRARFFDDVVTTLGLSEHIHVRWEGESFFMEASPRWKLSFPVAELRGKNPRSFMIAGFANIQEAVQYGEKLAARYAEVKPAPSFGGNFSKSEYERLRAQINGQSGPWKGQIFGSLRRESKDALAGKFGAQTPAGPIPAFDWHTADTEEQVFGAITVQEVGGCLELSVEHRAECNLFAQTAFLTDVTFEEV